MARHFCPRCGLALQDGAAPVCDRCGLVFAAADPTRAAFDEANGLPLDGNAPGLRCWHCGEPISRDARICPTCNTALTRRETAAVRFEVASARHPSPPPRAYEAHVSAPLSAESESAGPWGPDTAPPRGYFRRHWRGELPLGVSVWVNVFLVSFALNIILLVVQRPIVWSDSGLVLFVVSLVIWLSRIAVASWQVVGVWRSAGASIRLRRRQKRTFMWAFIARVWIVFVALGWAVAFAILGFVSIRDNVQLAFGEDPVIPPYVMTVTPDGRGVVITGGVRFGIAGDLSAALDANPEIRTVYLTSEGGRMAPAGALFRVIRAHDLDTYAVGPCYSACTIAFAGGTNRVVGGSGELGFHAPSSAGEQSNPLEQSVLIDFFQPYRDAGFADAVILRARMTPPEDMWFPTDATLLGGNVMTAPRDTVSRPDSIPVAMYLQGLVDGIAPYLPAEIARGLSIASLEVDGDRLTMVMTVARDIAVPAAVYAPVTPMLCGMAGRMEGATYLFIARYPDGEEISRSEFDSIHCSVASP